MSVITGDCRDVLRAFPDNTFGYVITDPPYGLSRQPNMAEVLKHWLDGDDYHSSGSGFMGKSWDSFVPGPATWREVLRVMKPGAYALAFAGSRTNYLMTTSLRLAGFDIVDQLLWLYGSGFPKSLDVAKQIDARDGLGAKLESARKFTAWMRDNCPLSRGQIDALLGTNGMGGHFVTKASQPEVPTRAQFDKIKLFIPGVIPAEIERIVDQRQYESENLKRRPVIGKHKKANAMRQFEHDYAPQAGEFEEVVTPDITRAYSPTAKDWEGWGTALKPAYEPIIVARKPLDGTYANNLMAHGCGALNIDGSRNGERWPANILHDGGLPEPMDRYYYCAKATQADRNAGLYGLRTLSTGECTGGRAEGSAGLNSPRSGAGRTAGSKNPHPTVKPQALCEWLLGLVARPELVGLDPFAGSGSQLRAAATNGQNMVGIEKDKTYAEIARLREQIK